MNESEAYTHLFIDTNTYAGNIERQMVAFITGQIGQCGVGEDYAEMAKKELSGERLDWFSKNVVHLPDNHHCHRPARVAATPGLRNNGMGFVFSEGQEELAQEMYVKACKDMAEYKPHIDKSMNDGYRSEWLQKSKQKFEGCPAYFSVEIVFQVEPDEGCLVVIKERAELFSKLPLMSVVSICRYENFSVTGFRLLKSI